MMLQKFKSDNHLSLMEARRRLSTQTPGNYAETVKSTKANEESKFVTHEALQNIMENFFIKVQNTLLQALQQQTEFFQKTMENVVHSFSTTLQKYESQTQKQMESKPRLVSQIIDNERKKKLKQMQKSTNILDMSALEKTYKVGNSSNCEEDRMVLEDT